MSTAWPSPRQTDSTGIVPPRGKRELIEWIRTEDWRPGAQLAQAPRCTGLAPRFSLVVMTGVVGAASHAP